MARRKYTILSIIIILLMISISKCNSNKNTIDIKTKEPAATKQTDTVIVNRTDSTASSYIMPTDTTRFGKIHISIGNKPSFKSKVWLWGNQSFYNTKTYHPFVLTSKGDHSNDLTEPSWFIQAQYEFAKDTYFGIHVNKEKFRANRNEFGFAGPTDLGISYGLSFNLFNTNWLSANVSLAGGYTIGRPRFQTPWWEPEYGTQHIFTDKMNLGNDYEIIGMFSTLITRFDIRVSDRYNLFVATTLNYRFIQDYETSIGTQSTGEIYSFGINVGLGINFNYKKKKQKIEYLPKF